MKAYITAWVLVMRRLKALNHVNQAQDWSSQGIQMGAGGKGVVNWISTQVWANYHIFNQWQRWYFKRILRRSEINNQSQFSFSLCCDINTAAVLRYNEGQCWGADSIYTTCKLLLLFLCRFLLLNMRWWGTTYFFCTCCTASNIAQTRRKVLQSSLFNHKNVSYKQVCTEGRPCPQDLHPKPDVYLRFNSVYLLHVVLA